MHGFLFIRPITIVNKVSRIVSNILSHGFSALAVILLAFASVTAAYALGRGTIALTSTPDVIMADGKSTTTIMAEVRDGDGNLVPDGTSVKFLTSLGYLDKDVAETRAGIARVTLTSSPTAGDATIDATSFTMTGDSATASSQVEFTKDHDAVFNLGEGGWIRIDCPGELLYSADNQVIEVHGVHGSVHFEFQSLSMRADSLQINLGTELILAHNAVLTRDNHVVKVIELSYDLRTNTGTGIAKTPTSPAQAVTITGSLLEVIPVQPGLEQPNTNVDPYAFADLSDSTVVVTARSMAVDPGKQIQFKRATIWSSGKKVISLPLHVMPLNSTQVFGQQVIGMGSMGFFVNIPYYYHLSPGSTGTLYLRNSAAAGMDGMTATGGYVPQVQGSRSRLALDLEQTYSFGTAASGTFLINGITRSDWGASWTHTQRFEGNTNTNFDVNYTAQHSVFASSNLAKDFGPFSLNFAANLERTPGFDGSTFSSRSVSSYVQFNPLKIGASGISMATDFSLDRNSTDGLEYTGSANDLQPIHNSISTYGIGTRLYTDPIHAGPKTTFSDSLTLGERLTTDTHKFGANILGTLGMTSELNKTTHFSVTYNYRLDPLQGESTLLDSTGHTLYSSSPVSHRIYATFTSLPLPKLSLSVVGGYGLPLHDSNLFTNMTYHYNDDWGLGFNSYMNKFGFGTYKDYELTVSRRFLGRYLLFGYSTQEHRLRFDLSATGY